MFDLVKWLLRIAYYKARLLGGLNFEIDFATGRARETNSARIQTAIVNLICLSMPVFLCRYDQMYMLWSGAVYLHEYLFMVFLGTRCLCVYTSMIVRWWQVRRLVHLINAFQRLAVEKPQVTRLWHRGVICKFLSGTLIAIMEITVFLYSLWSHISYKQILILCIFIILSTHTDCITYQYYLALLNVYGHYILLNREIRAVLIEARSLKLIRHRGGFMIKCCTLADRLEIIAKSQSYLQSIVHRMSSLFGLQNCCIAINYYLYTICIIFFAYSSYKHNLGWSSGGILLVIIKVIFYFTDMFVSVSMSYVVLDAHSEMVNLLAEQSDSSFHFDERLETVYQCFVLQLARSPLKLPILNLFNLDRKRGISMVSSVVINCTVVIQYDLKMN